MEENKKMKVIKSRYANFDTFDKLLFKLEKSSAGADYSYIGLDSFPDMPLSTSTEDLYFSRLFMEYLKEKGIPSKNANEYLTRLIMTNNYKLENICSMVPAYADYINRLDNQRGYFLDYLCDSGLDLTKEDIFELNKGEFDSAVSEYNTVISKYGSTMNMTNCILYRINNQIYALNDEGFLYSLPEEATVIIQNPYNVRELIYNLHVLAGTNTNVILGSWGNYSNVLRLRILKVYLNIIKQMSNIEDNIEIVNMNETTLDNISCNAFRVNTKKLKQIVDLQELMSYEELCLLRNAFEHGNHCYNEDFFDVFEEETKRRRK